MVRNKALSDDGFNQIAFWNSAKHLMSSIKDFQFFTPRVTNLCYHEKYMKFKKLETEIERNRIYKHYRGNRYIVVDIAKNSDMEGDNFYVVYRALYDHGQLYITSIERFTGVNSEGKKRFILIEDEEKDILDDEQILAEEESGAEIEETAEV